MKWLSLERKFIHQKLYETELELYGIHSKILMHMNNSIYYQWWENKLVKINEIVIKRSNFKKNKLKNKLKNLINNKSHKTNKIEHVPNYINNFSSELFSEEKMSLLNKGLNFPPKPNKIDFESTIADIETSIKYLNIWDKENIRKAVKPYIKNAINLKPSFEKTDLTIKNLKAKDVIYILNQTKATLW